jgi:hypothetical protein
MAVPGRRQMRPAGSTTRGCELAGQRASASAGVSTGRRVRSASALAVPAPKSEKRVGHPELQSVTRPGVAGDGQGRPSAKEAVILLGLLFGVPDRR